MGTLRERVTRPAAASVRPRARARAVRRRDPSVVVVGETAVVDDDCTLLHGVTLGGTGKVRGDRHPKLGKRVVVGSNASVLGNVKVGHDCKIGAGAALIHDLPPNTTIVGHKGRVVTKKQITSKL